MSDIEPPKKWTGYSHGEKVVMGVSAAVLLAVGGAWYAYDSTAEARATAKSEAFCADMGTTQKDVDDCRRAVGLGR